MAENRGAFVERAQRLAEEVLYPAASAVDGSGQVPGRHWEVLAEEGFYGLPVAGLEFPEIVRVIELLAGGCLATAFVWLQHNGAVLSLAGSQNAALREMYFDDLVSGRRRAGAAFAGAVTEPAKLWARPVEGGYVLNGTAPFVSGWGIVDLLQVAARSTDEKPGDTVVSGLIEASASDTMSAEPIALIAGQATATVRLRFDDHPLPAARVTGVARFGDFAGLQTFGSRLNGALACGIADRAIILLDAAAATSAAKALREQLDGVRVALDQAMADAAALQVARGQAAELAVRAATALVAATGAAALLPELPAGRLLREAAFTSVAASRPEMRAAIVDVVSAPR
ncbi:acyl-CoA dehydrogenase family protein [Nocardia sp. NPDC048505]|uniref:acyl-CoA dehydrogenase family protein n=1 Tax=unclassified Nocardia TaxID=2637762 RepID=UPI0033C95A1C